MISDNRCIICSTLLTRRNSHYKSELCFNCEYNVDSDYEDNKPKKKSKKKDKRIKK